MFNYQDEIKDFYNVNNEDIRLKRTRVNNIEFLTTAKYLDNVCPQQSKILDACAGTGVYSFYLAEKGHKVVAGDLVESNVEFMKRKQEKDNVLDSIYTGSITDLSRFPDESFDVVLNLGSFYHLLKESKRKRSIEESLRVLKPNGVYFLSYINRYANIIKFRDEMKDKFDQFEGYLKNGYIDNNSIFYSSTPEKIEMLMEKFNLHQVHNVATDGMKFIIRETVNSFDDIEFKRYMKMHYQMCEVKSLLGYSEHALYVGKK